MKIGFNGRFLAKPYTGIGQYSLNLLTAMSAQSPETEWVVTVPQPVNGLILPENVKIVVVKEAKLPSASLRMWWWEQIQCPKALKKHKPDLIHYPYPANPRFSSPWTLKKTKTVVTVHDVIPWKRPEYRKKLRSRLYQNSAKKALKKANHIIAVSQTTGLEATEMIRYPFHSVSVIHEAASPDFSHMGGKIDAKRPYMLYVGGYDPRKNVTRLIEAYQEYIAPKYEIDLVLIGAEKAMKDLEKGSNRLLEALPESKMKSPQNGKGSLKGGIVQTGTLTPEKLAKYYRGALGFVNVSLAEGFNLPLLEAAASHIPILTSDLPIHREIIGSNGLFCDPNRTKNIGEMLLNFVRDKDLQESLIQKAIDLSTQYTWEKAAQATLTLYKRLV